MHDGVIVFSVLSVCLSVCLSVTIMSGNIRHFSTHQMGEDHNLLASNVPIFFTYAAVSEKKQANLAH